MIRTCLLILLAAAVWAAAPVESAVAYAHDGLALRGTLAMPAGADANRPLPGVLVVHEWWGVNAYARQRARELAEAGFAAFACDMYGDGRSSGDPAQAKAWATPFYQDRALLLARARAGLAAFAAQPGVDKARTAAIGFCFGGTVCLELARAGEPLKAVVALHPGLKTGTPAAPGAVAARVLVLTGGADPLVPPADVAAFMGEMESAKAAWRLVSYGGALHAFTNPAAAKLHATMAAVDHHPEAERAAMEATRAWLTESLR